MKKINNKFRGNAVYSLNYKFDSVSPAGKCSGTALDLIKRYNELAKEAQNNGDYVGMEVFRQYAEHYRKIVTEINERKYQTRDNQTGNNAGSSEGAENNESATEVNNGLVETQAATPAESTITGETSGEAPASEPAKKVRRARAFTVVDASKSAEVNAAEKKDADKPRHRTAVRRSSKTETKEQVAE